MQFISTDKKFEVFGQFAIAHSRRWGGRPGCPGALPGTSWRWVRGFGQGMVRLVKQQAGVMVGVGMI